MTIYFCGDPHGHLDQIIQAVEQGQPEAVVLLGDIEAPKPLNETLAAIWDKTEVWFIHGNHDTDRPEYWANLNTPEVAPRNLHGTVQSIAGKRIAGLGGIFRGAIWRPPEEPVTFSYQQWEQQQAAEWVNQFDEAAVRHHEMVQAGKRLTHQSSIFCDDYYALVDEPADILVTHEAPACHPLGFKEIDELAVTMGVQRVIHGHHHEDLNYDAFNDTANALADKSRYRVTGVGKRSILNSWLVPTNLSK